MIIRPIDGLLKLSINYYNRAIFPSIVIFSWCQRKYCHPLVYFHTLNDSVWTTCETHSIATFHSNKLYTFCRFLEAHCFTSIFQFRSNIGSDRMIQLYYNYSLVTFLKKISINMWQRTEKCWKLCGFVTSAWNMAHEIFTFILNSALLHLLISDYHGLCIQDTRKQINFVWDKE